MLRILLRTSPGEGTAQKINSLRTWDTFRVSGSQCTDSLSLQILRFGGPGRKTLARLLGSSSMWTYAAYGPGGGTGWPLPFTWGQAPVVFVAAKKQGIVSEVMFGPRRKFRFGAKSFFGFVRQAVHLNTERLIVLGRLLRRGSRFGSCAGWSRRGCRAWRRWSWDMVSEVPHLPSAAPPFKICPSRPTLGLVPPCLRG